MFKKVIDVRPGGRESLQKGAALAKEDEAVALAANESARRLVVMMELRPAFDGFAGIPQETRLLFRGLSLLHSLKVEGLLQGSRRTLARGTRRSNGRGRWGTQSEHRRINRYSRVVISAMGRPQTTTIGRAMDIVRDHIKPLTLTIGALLGVGRIRLTEFRSTYFEDFIWRSFFAKTLPATDFDLVARADMRVSSVSWHAMHDAGLNTLSLLRRPIYPRLDTTGVDILVAQTPFPGRVADGTRLVVRYHDAIPVFMPHTIADRSSHQAEHFNALMNCVRSGAWFACVSDATRRDLLRLFPEAACRAVVIHNMVSHHYFSDSSGSEKVPEIIRSRINEGNAKLQLAPKFRTLGEEDGFYRSCLHDRPLRYLLIVSTLEPRKNHARLLAAWETLKSDVDPDLKLIVVGSLGWSAQEIVQGMQPWIDRGDLFALHCVPAPDLRVLYRHALATVCPSLGEGFDYSGVEAMRCGGVVIASDIPVHREIYDDASEYFDPYSTASLVNSLTKVLYQPGADAAKANLRIRGAAVSERYLPERVLPQWEELLNRIGPHGALPNVLDAQELEPANISTSSTRSPAAP